MSLILSGYKCQSNGLQKRILVGSSSAFLPDFLFVCSVGWLVCFGLVLVDWLVGWLFF